MFYDIDFYMQEEYEHLVQDQWNEYVELEPLFESKVYISMRELENEIINSQYADDDVPF